MFCVFLKDDVSRTHLVEDSLESQAARRRYLTSELWVDNMKHETQDNILDFKDTSD